MGINDALIDMTDSQHKQTRHTADRLRTETIGRMSLDTISTNAIREAIETIELRNELLHAHTIFASTMLEPKRNQLEQTRASSTSERKTQ